MILYRSFTENCGDAGAILFERSLREDLADAMVTGACMKTLVGGSWEVLVRLVPAAAGPFVMIL